MTEQDRLGRVIIGIGHRYRRGKDTAAEYLAERHGFTIMHFATALKEECREVKIVLVENKVSGVVRLEINDFSRYFRSSGSNNDPRVEALVEKARPWIEKAGRLHYDSDDICEWCYEGMRRKDGPLLQWYGTEFRRTFFGQHYWVHKLQMAIELSDAQRIVIPDMRFWNEACFCQEVGMSHGDWQGQHLFDWQGAERREKWSLRAPCRSGAWRVWADKPWGDTGGRDDNHLSEIELNSWPCWNEDLENNGTLDELYEKVDAAWARM